ncbi:hypothetical protein JCM8097_008867 [Rhodosporidiobolus ruineniae]
MGGQATASTTRKASSRPAMQTERQKTATQQEERKTRRASTLRPLSLASSSLRPLSTISSSRSPTLSRPLAYTSYSPSSPLSPPPVSPRLDPPTVSSSTSATRLEAVEQRKLQLKRQTLLARQHERSGSTHVLPDDHATPSGEGSPIPRSKRWFSRLASSSASPSRRGAEDENVPPSPVEGPNRSTAALPLRTRQDRSPTPPFFASTSPNLPLLPVKQAAAARQDTAAAPSTPTKGSLRGPAAGGAGGKKGRYAGLGVVRVRKGKEVVPAAAAQTEEQVEEVEVLDETMRHVEGYSSLQELLERHGYRDTRVVTPQSKQPRKSSFPAASPTASPRRPSASSLAPPAATIKEKASVLSLRGLFSLWSPSPDPSSSSPPLPASTSAPHAGGANADAQSLSNGSSGTLGRRARHIAPEDVQDWQAGVAIAYSSSSSSSGAAYSLAPTPQLVLSSRTGVVTSAEQFGSPTMSGSIDGRSYSSSLSLSASPPTPHSLRYPPPQPTIAVSHAEPDALPHDLAGGAGGTAKKALRSVVSESALGSTGAALSYESFTGLGISVPSSFLDIPSSSTHPSRAVDPPSPARPSPAPAAGPGSAGVGSWFAASLPTFSLRQRASQIFSLSPSTGNCVVDAATGRRPTPPSSLSSLSSTSAGARKAGGAGPRLLRKANSSAGLTRPVECRATVGTRSSAESLSLSIDSFEMGGGGEAGGGGAGEDLLGRRWG